MCLQTYQEIMRGIRNPCDGLWDIPIPTQHIHTNTLTQQEKFCTQQHTQPSNIYSAIHLVASHPSLSVIIRKDTTKLDLAQYLHAACFSPVKSTWARAIDNNHFSTWSGLTLQLIWKHLPVSLAMVQGHLKQEQQGLQSTSPLKRPNPDATSSNHTNINDDIFPLSPTPNKQTHDVAYAIIDPTNMINAYFDLAGKFPQRSSSGNQYILHFSRTPQEQKCNHHHSSMAISPCNV